MSSRGSTIAGHDWRGAIKGSTDEKGRVSSMMTRSSRSWSTGTDEEHKGERQKCTNYAHLTALPLTARCFSAIVNGSRGR